MATNDDSLLVVTFGALALALVMVGATVFDGLIATIMIVCGALAGLVALMYLFGGFDAQTKE